MSLLRCPGEVTKCTSCGTEPSFGPHSFTLSKDNNLNKKHKNGNI